MKKSILITAVAAMAATAGQAQTVVDAVRYGQNDISGTARYRSMAGAFGALGGDPSVMSDNPAGLAIYRGTNVFSITPHLNMTSMISRGTEKWTEKSTNTGLSNFATIFSFKTEYSDNIVNFNVGIGFERRLENISKLNTVLDDPRTSFAQYLTDKANNYLKPDPTMAWGNHQPSTAFDWLNDGTTAPILTMLGYNTGAFVDDPNDKHAVMNPVKGRTAYQRLYMKEHTRLDQYNISAAMNVNDRFYVGATMVITDFNSTILSDFSEDYTHDYTGTYTYYENDMETKGAGIGFNLGVIWTPMDQLRLGAAIHSPVYTTVEEIYYGGMEVYDDELYKAGEADYMWNDTFDDWWKYEMKTPWEYQLSAAYIISNYGLISVEYDLRDFSSMQMRHNRSYGLTDYYFNEANLAIEEYAAKQHTFKIGAEYRITKRLSARAGYAKSSSPYIDETFESRISASKRVDEKNTFGGSPAVNVVYYSPTKPNYQLTGGQQYVTAGLGWRGKTWTFDFAYMLHHIDNNVAAFPAEFGTNDPIQVDYVGNSFDLTLGYRF